MIVIDPDIRRGHSAPPSALVGGALGTLYRISVRLAKKAAKYFINVYFSVW
jgi:hypothetical protein